jgi:Lysozyme like domain
MATLTPVQLIQLVRTYHRAVSARTAIIAVAIALAESGGHDNAISPSHDYGLWQINRIHFGDGIINASNWTNHAVQVAEMWKLSAAGSNWAAWCTVFGYNPSGRCGHGFVSYPEPGSPAADQLNVSSVAWYQALGRPIPGPSTPAVPPNEQLSPGESRDYTYLKNFCAVYYPRHLLAMNRIRSSLFDMFTH